MIVVSFGSVGVFILKVIIVSAYSSLLGSSNRNLNFIEQFIKQGQKIVIESKSITLSKC